MAIEPLDMDMQQAELRCEVDGCTMRNQRSYETKDTEYPYSIQVFIFYDIEKQVPRCTEDMTRTHGHNYSIMRNR